MDPGLASALIGATGTALGAAVAGPVVAHVLSRRMRSAQAAQLRAQTEQIAAQTGLLRQDIYQQLTEDLRAELVRVTESLRLTSAEAERLRLRVVELETRIAQLELHEQHLSAELRAVQAERDQLRIQLSAKEATVAALQQQIGDLKAHQAATLQATTHPTT